MIAPAACVVACLLTALSALAVEPDLQSPVSPPVRPLGVHCLGIGEVILDRRDRVVRIPAFVNLRAGLVEYALVTTRGKLHESTFATTADPAHIHVALLLLGLQATTARYEDSTGATPNDGPAPDAPPLRGPGVHIRVAIPRPHGRVWRPLTALVQAASTHAPLPATPWTYNGSLIYNGQFAASVLGSVIALQHDPTALINNPLPSRLDDSYHLSHTRRLPAAGTPVTIEIRPIQPVASASGR